MSPSFQWLILCCHLESVRQILNRRSRQGFLKYFVRKDALQCVIFGRRIRLLIVGNWPAVPGKSLRSVRSSSSRHQPKSSENPYAPVTFGQFITDQPDSSDPEDV